jgi:hypothetical protein
MIYKYATLDQSRGDGRGLRGRLLAERKYGILEMILVNMTRAISPDRLHLLDTAVSQLTMDDNGYSALENGLKLCAIARMCLIWREQGGWRIVGAYDVHARRWQKAAKAPGAVVVDDIIGAPCY